MKFYLVIGRRFVYLFKKEFEYEEAGYAQPCMTQDKTKKCNTKIKEQKNKR